MCDATKRIISSETDISLQSVKQQQPWADDNLQMSFTANIAFPYARRAKVKGKFIYIGDEKFFVRGVTYGTFRPTDDFGDFPHPEVVDRDFMSIAKSGINTVRIYTIPPRWLLDTAQRYGLRVMVGIPWEQHIAFFDYKGQKSIIEDRVRGAIRSCAKHAAILCYAVGNEIPASIVRFYGRRRIERFIRRLYRIAKSEDPDSLVTYVNFPTTEYLQLPFLDFFCFNVYLESPLSYRAYINRLQNIAGELPLIVTEIGLDSRRNGLEVQACSLDMQIRLAFLAGCAGAFVFAWTDEWHRGGYDIEDWDFGLTTRDRIPKPALAAVQEVFSEAPFSAYAVWPRISVVVCSFNGARHIRDTLEGLKKIDYPDYEVIVISDGSTDKTPDIAKEYDVKLICTKNHGLSSARNEGLEAATGEIVAYIDDDAFPDIHWLKYLATSFLTTSCAAVGGHNITPPGDGLIADCVDAAPGRPIHVLISDEEAEHIPGCNMAFQKAAIEAVGGFDPCFRIAGDDVDICWKLREHGWKIGFNPAAIVFHHRRNSIKAYWKQQKAYGEAEALLEQKWPERYNATGHITWCGDIYCNNRLRKQMIAGKYKVYHGVWGTALFQSLYKSPAPSLLSVFLVPEGYIVIAFFAALSCMGTLWRPLLLLSPLVALAFGILTLEATLGAKCVTFRRQHCSIITRTRMQAVTAFLHFVHLLARLIGRLEFGLTPWRHRGVSGFALPMRRQFTIWSQTWRAPESWLNAVRATLRQLNIPISCGGDFDSWDIEVPGGTLGSVRLLMGIEEHGSGRQLIRFRVWPRCAMVGLILILFLGVLSIFSATDHAWVACVILFLIAFLFSLQLFRECAHASATLHSILLKMREEVEKNKEAL